MHRNPPLSSRYTFWIIIIMSLIITVLDFLVGPEYAISLFYIFPVMWAGWQRGFLFATILALILCGLRFTCHWVWGFPLYISPAAVNTVIRAISLMLLAFLASQLAWKYQKLKLRIHQLEGHLPVCSSCSSVRREDGDWIPLDTPIPKDGVNQKLCPHCIHRSSLSRTTV